jgi:uncharacterized membrane protein
MPDIDSKPRRSKFVVFTYAWQAFMVLLFIGALVVAAFAFFAGDGTWVVDLVNCVTFVLCFFTASLWRSTDRITRATRARTAETYRILGMNK